MLDCGVCNLFIILFYLAEKKNLKERTNGKRDIKKDMHK